MIRSKRKKLPSLGAFASFEVAAKYLSFTLAARELNVSQAAVGQQVRLLEKELNVSLFFRQHNCLELTKEGAHLLDAVSNGLDTIGSAILALGSEEANHTITCSATSGVSEYWLKPLMDKFREIYPDVGFVVLSSDEDDALRNFDEVDLAFVCGNERCAVGEELHFLFLEEVQPICSPAFLEQHGPFPDVNSLNHVNLLHLHEKHWSSDAIGWASLSWENWFEANGEKLLARNSSLVTNSYPILIQAALAGEGVILGWKHITKHLVENGFLSHANERTLKTERGNFLKCNKDARTKPCVLEFMDLILTSSENKNSPHPAQSNKR